MLNELLELPSPFFSIDPDILKNIANAFDKIVLLKKNVIGNDAKIKELEQNIFNEFIKHFSLSDREVALIEDTMLFGLGLFREGHNSIGFRRTQLSENRTYAETLYNDINSFLLSSDTKASATIYDVQLNDPLNLVILHFGKEVKEIEIKNITELRKQLQEIDKYTVQKKCIAYMYKNI